MKLTTATYHNVLDEQRRRALQADVQRHRLADRTHTHQPRPVDSRLRLLPLKWITVLFLLAVTLLLPAMAGAQDRKDRGDFTAFPEAMIAYRVGHYYFVQGDYERAVSEYTAAIDGIPTEIFETSVDYAVMYWDMGDAQFMAGDYAAALDSYLRYLELSGDQTSAEVITYVEQFQQALDNGKLTQITLISETV